MDKAQREQAEKVVDRYLTVLMSRDDEAGWQGAGILGRIIEFRGELPDSSGFSGFSTVWEKGQHLRNWSYKYIAAFNLVNRLPVETRTALVLDRAYRGRVKVAIDPFVPDKRVECRWDDEKCGRVMNVKPDTFAKKVLSAYRDLLAQMGVTETA